MTHTPYGYKIVDAKAVIDELTAKKVQLLFSEFLACGSMRAAAKKVGIKKTHSVIGRILKNKRYLGTDYYPQVIDEITFQKVQELRAQNAKSQNRIREYMVPQIASEPNFIIGKIDNRYDDPYKQAQYAYGLIQEETNE